MPLSAGTRLGPYEILAPIGAGGMGEVYKAKDTKLDREVAIKVLPAALAQDPERLARFEREARVLASLNHPNIAQIYGIEERALVMELVPGETLKGPLPIETALDYAKQIAEALEAAHEKGITHRDLKPANIMITPAHVVKVLDFGLAAVTQPSGTHEGDPSQSPTLTIRTTQASVIMGTVAYMSPEQASGKPVDRRADVWSFGVVLWEMLTGHRLFDGETVSHISAAVLTKEPDWRLVPMKARKLLQSCLQKDAKQRLQAIGDWRLLLEDAPQAAPPPPPAQLPWLAWVLAALCLLIAVAAFFVHFRGTPPEQRIVRFDVGIPERSSVQAVKLSPDGRYLAFTASVGGSYRLWIRPLDSTQAQPLPGTEGAQYPFWSPDSAFIGFFAQGKLKRIAASGGPAQTLADAPQGRGGAWSRDGVILYAADVGGILHRTPAVGGVSSPVTKLTSPSTHRFPEFLPDGHHFLFLVEGTAPGIYVGSLDGDPPVRILPDDSNAVYCPPAVFNPVGYLLFARQGALMAQPFDSRRLRPSGDPLLVTSDPVNSASSYSSFSVSGNGTLGYALGLANRQLVWRDRMGKQLGMIGKPDTISFESLSLDDKRVAYATGRIGSSTNLWLYDVARQTTDKFTFGAGIAQSPVWSPDGSRIVFASSAEPSQQVLDIFVKPTSGAAKPELLQRSVGYVRITDWSADGKFVVYIPDTNTGKSDLWLLPMEGERKPVPYLQSEFAEYHAQISRDGRWMAYTSTESGQEQVYVQPVPATGTRWPVSPAGGSRPRWRRDATELFYMATDGMLMAVPVKTGAAFETGTPKPLFGPLRPVAGTPYQFYYQPTADGQRFLVNEPAEEDSGRQPITVVLNWQAGLKK